MENESLKRSYLSTLSETYVELNKLNASPGEKAHMLAYSIRFIEKQIKLLIKEVSNASDD